MSGDLRLISAGVLHPENRCSYCGATGGLSDRLFHSTFARGKCCTDTVACAARCYRAKAAA